MVLYNCTYGYPPGYPVLFRDVSLLEVRGLHSKYAHRVKAIGFSGHHSGIAVEVAAYALGASWFERRFAKVALDHAVSLGPTGLQRVCHDLIAIHGCMTYKTEENTAFEKKQRFKLEYYTRDLHGSSEDDSV